MSRAAMAVKNKFLEMLPGVPFLPPESMKQALEDGYAIRKNRVEETVFDLYALGADTTELEALYEEAEKLYDQGKVKEAFEKLKGYQALAKKAEEDAAGNVTAEQKNQVFKIRYEKKKERVQQGIDQLKSMPGIGPRVIELEAEVRIADAFAQQEKYESAYNALTGFTGKMKAATNDSSAGISNLPEKKNLKMKTAYNGAMAALAKFEVFFPEQVVTAERNKIMAAAEPVLAARTAKKKEIAKAGMNPLKKSKAKSEGDKKMAEEALKQIIILENITSDLNTRTVNQRDLKGTCDKRSSAIEKDLNELVTLADSTIVIELQTAFEEAKKLSANNRYAEAVISFTTVQVKARKKLTAARKDKIAWTNAKPAEVLENNSDLRGYPVTRDAFSTIADEIRLLIGNTDKFRGYGAAVTRLNELKEQIRVLREVTLKAYNDDELDDAREQAKDDVYAPAEELEKNVTVLKMELKKAGGSGGLPDEIDEKIATLKKTWENQVQTITDIEVFKKAKEEYLKELATVTQEVETARKSPETLSKLAGDEKSDAARKAYETARTAANVELKKLAIGGGSDYDLKLKEYKATDATAADDYVAAKSKMETLQNQVAGLLQTQSTNLANKKKEVETKADEVDRLIKQVRGKAGRAFKDFFDDMAGQAKDIRSLSKGANLDVLELSLTQLTQLQNDVSELGRKAAEKGPAAQSFKAVLAKISSLRKQLKADLPAKVAKRRRKEMWDELGELTKEVKLLPPDQALRRLSMFESEVKGAAVVAQAALKTRADCELKLNEVKQALAASGIRKELTTGDKSKFFAGLKGRIKAAVKQAKTEGEEVDALSALEEIRKEIVELSGDRLAIAEKEKAALEESSKQDTAKLQWEAQFKNFDRDIVGPAEKAVKVPDGDSSQVDRLKDLKKPAQQAAKAGDFVKAMDELEKAKAMSKQIVDNPQGFKKTSRGKLPKLKKNWAAAVAGFDEEVESLAKTIEGWVPTELTPTPEQSVMTKAANEIRELKKLFEAQAFDVAIDTLAGDTPLPTRKAEREKALRNLRKFRAALERDKLVTMVLDNPFQRGVLGACKRLLSTLADIEENILICV